MPKINSLDGSGSDIRRVDILPEDIAKMSEAEVTEFLARMRSQRESLPAKRSGNSGGAKAPKAIPAGSYDDITEDDIG